MMNAHTEADIIRTRILHKLTYAIGKDAVVAQRHDWLRATILAKSNMSLGNGLGKLNDRVFRIGHLGDIGDLQMVAALGGVEMGLAAAGVPHKAGGVQVAMGYLNGNS